MMQRRWKVRSSTDAWPCTGWPYRMLRAGERHNLLSVGHNASSRSFAEQTLAKGVATQPF